MSHNQLAKVTVKILAYHAIDIGSPLKVCRKINLIVMGLTTWMKKCVDSVQV